ncbi:MAG TPA: YSC84-related protein [Vicinamibacterales bacterium]|nr:YSC84-related protein [Vicinamibacterales bacterium]
MKAVRIAAIAAIALIAFAPLHAARQADRDAKEVADAIALFKSSDKDLAKWFTSSYGYAVFPNVTKGAVGVGGAGGNGRVFEKAAYIGDARMTQVTVGVALGGQSYSEVIFFENKEALDRFKDNKLEMTAGWSAVAASEGASNNAKYTQGVAVFTVAKKGLMAEASVGGQKFKFTPKK